MGKAYAKCANLQIAMNGFKKCGSYASQEQVSSSSASVKQAISQSIVGTFNLETRATQKDLPRKQTKKWSREANSNFQFLCRR
ncbi:hypothetical protein C0J52_08320 [Blattella germanica]|nr:hypothetical protein C0J52_08320 [Blattella germanica]